MSALGNPAFERAGAGRRRSPVLGEAGYSRRDGDFYPTEDWVTHALCDAVELVPPDLVPGGASWPIIWEPACGDGRMARVLNTRLRHKVLASDLHDRGFGQVGIDFLTVPRIDCDLIVTNPPFALDREFIARALALTAARRGTVAMLHRHEFDAPKANRHLFQPPSPFLRKLVLPRRPRWAIADDGRGQRKGGRFAYAWYLWDWAAPGPLPTLWLDEPGALAAAAGAGERPARCAA